MRITVKVVLRAKNNMLEEIRSGEYKVRLSVPPVDGKANKKVIEILSDHFSVPKSMITIVRGAHARTKIIDIDL